MCLAQCLTLFQAQPLGYMHIFKYLHQCILGVFAITALHDTHSNATVSAEDLIALALSTKLAEHPTWIKLVHYEKNTSSDAGHSSEIYSDSFFLSSQGRHSPKRELFETITAFLKPLSGEKDGHAQCRFPGRYVWLSKILPLKQAQPTNIRCDAYRAWAGDSTKSISLVFASGYLGNPASYYGHTLIKLNSLDPNKSSLLDTSINFGAIIPSNESFLPYILKGITGGYDGRFSHTYHYFHDHNYGELELRDLWEYELSMSDYQLSLVLGHLWEILGKQYTYYFFKKNCAYRMAEVFDLIEGLSILPKNYPWVFPQTVVTNLYHGSVDGKDVLASIKYHPSRQSRLYQSFDRLSEPEREIFKNAVTDIGELTSSSYQKLNDNSKHAILDVLQNYFQFLNDDEKPTREYEEKHTRVLLERFQLPIKTSSPKWLARSPPHSGRKPSYSQFGFMSDGNEDIRMLVNIRPSYYDALDASNGHIEHSELKMFHTQLHVSNAQVRLASLDFISINAVNGAKTGLPQDNGLIWHLNAGVERQNLACTNCLVARLKGDVGSSKLVSKNMLLGLRVRGVIQNSRNGYGALYGKLSAFANLRLNRKTNLHLTIGHVNYLDSQHTNHMDFSIKGRYAISKNMDFRIGIRKNHGEEYNVGLGYYW